MRFGWPCDAAGFPEQNKMSNSNLKGRHGDRHTLSSYLHAAGCFVGLFLLPESCLLLELGVHHRELCFGFRCCWFLCFNRIYEAVVSSRCCFCSNLCPFQSTFCACPTRSVTDSAQRARAMVSQRVKIINDDVPP